MKDQPAPKPKKSQLVSKPKGKKVVPPPEETTDDEEEDEETKRKKMMEALDDPGFDGVATAGATASLQARIARVAAGGRFSSGEKELSDISDDGQLPEKKKK